MTTDRTRAIVEAAERLAKGLDLSVTPSGGIYRTGHARECECDHEDDLDALLIPLGRALALPEAPSVPEANLRAVYEAAMRFVKEAGTADVHAKKLDVDCNEADAYAVLVRALSLPPEHEPPRDLIALACDLRSIWRHDADGDLCTVGPNDEIEGILRAWDRAVERLDAPKWTRTPPSEPGWYWHRFNPRERTLIHIIHAALPKGSLMAIPMEPFEDAFRGEVDRGGEWWPVRLQEPPA